MIVFPAIDLLGGKAVRLAQGNYEQVTVYYDDPLEAALVFAEQGARWVHVVDLDGARDGEPANIDVVRRIAEESGLNVQSGGGIRSLGTMEKLASSGVSRFVLGTKLVTDREFVRKAVDTFGDRVVAGVDARDGEVKIAGWREGSSVAAGELVAELSSLGIQHLVYTDIARDGMRTGISAGAYKGVSSAAGFPVVVSGGVSTLEDVRTAAALGKDVVEGIIVGRAIYEGAFSVEQALETAAWGA